jgi:hypothetical protein
MSKDLLKRQLQQFIHIKELNLEMLDTLSVTAQWFIEFHQKTQIDIPNLEALKFLVRKINILLSEIDLYKRLPSDAFLHGDKSDEDFTEPRRVRDISYLCSMKIDW